jgi:CelD/BcsL family acetyltransferase involved in cellulose biosynthesis
MTARSIRTPIRWQVTDSLGRWATAWDVLVDSAPLPTPFLRSWWLSAVAGPAAQFVLFFDGSELVGGLALERRFSVLTVPVYRFIGGGALCPDHLDALAASGREDAVSTALCGWWQRPGSRVLYADGLAEQSLLEQIFGSHATTVIDVAPWAPLPPDPDEYIAARSANLRKSVHATENRFARRGIRLRHVRQDGLATALNDYTDLQRRRGAREALLAEMPRLSRAIDAGVAAGEADVDVLESDDLTIAVWISFCHAGALRSYQSARLLDVRIGEAGTMMLLESVRRAIGRGCRELDLLRGAEPYKMRFVDRERQVKRLHIAHGRGGRALLQAMENARRARAAARRTWARQRAVG